jgi:hypothetical protein
MAITITAMARVPNTEGTMTAATIADGGMVIATGP